MAYAAPAGHTLIDRRLYRPTDWCEDPQRRAATGVPDEVEFATKPALATQMITAAVDAGMSAGWVAGDEVYGAIWLRRRLQQRGIGHVLGIVANRTATTGVGAERVDVLEPSRCQGTPGNTARRKWAPRETTGIPGRSSTSPTATTTPRLVSIICCVSQR